MRRAEMAPREPVRWSTHSTHILLVAAAVVGGQLFGWSFALWPLSPVERWIGIGILAAVLAVVVKAALFLLRPVRR